MDEAQRILVVEDDGGLRRLLVDEFREAGLEAESAASAEDALSSLRAAAPSLIVTDLRLPGMQGIDLMREVENFEFEVPPAFVVITAFGSIEEAVDALKRGADDFITKPLDLEHLRLRVHRLLELQRLKQKVALHEIEAHRDRFHDIIGKSKPMRILFDDIRRVATGRGPVTIVGESGVGKELVARAIHRESARRDGPFVPVNCAGIPEPLLESEFFGHESGSFTGASRSRTGLFAEADGGTILLDEVAELPLLLQSKLLRVLQEGAVRRVGSNREFPLDVRVLVATNRDLEHEVEDKRFRKDLFFRLNTFTLEVPALRERGDDIDVLVGHFLRRFSREANKSVARAQQDVLDSLREYAYPGNVRELENIVEHAVTFCDRDTIELSDLPTRLTRGLREDGARTGSKELPAALTVEGELLTLEELTARYVEHVLSLTGGNKRRAASLLGVSRQTLYRHLEKRRELADEPR